MSNKNNRRKKGAPPPAKPEGNTPAPDDSASESGQGGAQQPQNRRDALHIALQAEYNFPIAMVSQKFLGDVLKILTRVPAPWEDTHPLIEETKGFMQRAGALAAKAEASRAGGDGGG